MFYIFVPSVHKKTCRRTEQFTWNRVSFLKHYCRICNLCMDTYESVTESRTTRFDNEGQSKALV